MTKCCCQSLGEGYQEIRGERGDEELGKQDMAKR